MCEGSVVEASSPLAGFGSAGVNKKPLAVVGVEPGSFALKNVVYPVAPSWRSGVQHFL